MLHSRKRDRGGNGLPWYRNPSFLADGSFPALNMDFIENRYALNGAPIPLSSIATFTRSTTKTYVDSTGQIQNAAIDAPAFIYDPETFAPLGLSIESSITNNAFRSEQPNQAYWTKNNTTVTINKPTAPDGNSTSCELIETTGIGLTYSISRLVTVTATIGQPYTISFFVKPNVRNQAFLKLLTATFGTDQVGIFNLTGSGSVASMTGGGTASIKYYAKYGFYRVSITATATAATSISIEYGAASAGAITYDGTLSNVALNFWGMQLENNNYASSYIQTPTAVGVTRAADSLTTSSIGAWANASTGSMLSDSISYTPTTVEAVPYAFTDGTVNNTLEAVYGATGTLTARRILAGASSLSTGLTYTQAVRYKTGMASSVAGSKFAVNNVLYTPTGAAAMPAVSQFDIGMRLNSIYLNGPIRSLIYYPIVLTDATLQAKTV